MAIGKDFGELMTKIGYSFSDPTYLQNALTHASYANELRVRGGGYPSNERLEFLGDAVLQILISEYLYENFTTKTEGTLTKMRQQLVCEKTLSQIAIAYNLGDYLNVGRGEETTDCRKRPKVLADALEAVIGAVYMDSNKFSSATAKTAILNMFSFEFDKCYNMQKSDYKTMLQQLIEKDGSALLEYVVTNECGPEHNKIFKVEARVNNNPVGHGEATTKKDAEMQAAKMALILFGVSV